MNEQTWLEELVSVANGWHDVAMYASKLMNGTEFENSKTLTFRVKRDKNGHMVGHHGASVDFADRAPVSIVMCSDQVNYIKQLLTNPNAQDNTEKFNYARQIGLDINNKIEKWIEEGGTTNLEINAEVVEAVEVADIRPYHDYLKAEKKLTPKKIIEIVEADAEIMKAYFVWFKNGEAEKPKKEVESIF